MMSSVYHETTAEVPRRVWKAPRTIQAADPLMPSTVSSSSSSSSSSTPSPFSPTRPRDCHSADALSPSLLIHLLQCEGVQQDGSLDDAKMRLSFCLHSPLPLEGVSNVMKRVGKVALLRIKLFEATQ